MKVEFQEGFKIVLIAETEMERIFLLEWDLRSNVELTDNRDRDCRFIDPDFITWMAQR